MKERLETFLKAGLKHWSFAARKDPEFCKWVEDETKPYENLNLTFPEKVYAAVSGVPPICPNGQQMKFDNIERGWRGCGPARTCACTRDRVSEKGKAAHAARSSEQIAETVTKRSQTNIQKYGHVNPGQSPRAKAGHAAFYSDPTKTAEAVAKGEQTMRARYGVKNALNLPKVNAIRPTIASSLSLEARQSRNEKRKALFIKRGDQRANDRCTTPVYISHLIPSVADYVESLGLTVIRTARNVIRNGAYSELDIYVPEKKVAIEYCGLYWHSTKDAAYHAGKFEAAEKVGVRLITIFSDEWELQPEAVKDRLRQILGRTERRIQARKTIVSRINAAEARAFLDDVHIQGFGRSPSVCYGLRNEDGDLVSVMTFGALRRSNNHTPADGHYEMYRFASVGSVVGGASKLFQAFVRDHDPQRIVTFADLRWGAGDVYRILGFRDNGRTAPGYWWVEGYAVRHHRWKFRKDALVAAGFPSTQTEDQIMFGRGFSKIWDCGNQRFEWTRPDKS